MATLYENIRPYDKSEGVALYFENKKISARAMHICIRRLVAYLTDKGIGRGDIVTVALPNIPLAVYLFYALDIIGAVQNVMHPLCTFEQLCRESKKLGGRNVILLESHYYENKDKIADGDGRFFFVNPMYDASALMRYAYYLGCRRAHEDGARVFLLDKFRKSDAVKVIDHRDDTECSVLLHSGGTTGEPKIIELSDRAISNLADKVDYITGDIEGMGMLSVLPLFHGFGLEMGIHAPLSNGAACVLMIKFKPKKVIKYINQGKINLMIGVPLLYRKLMLTDGFERARLDRLKFAFVGGDDVHTSLIDEFDAMMYAHSSGCRMYEGYGLTETVTVCTVNTQDRAKCGSVGRALRGITVTIRDEEQNPVPTLEVGEVYVFGNTAMNGYHGDRASTLEALVEIDGKTWVRTGDMGYLDADGYLWLKGRKKRIFKLSGMNVYPSEIEKTASAHPDVREAALEFYSEPKPHTKLFLLKAADSQRSNEDIKSDIFEALAREQLKYSMPSEVIFIDEFPRTKVGKTDHAALKDTQK